MSSTVNYLTFQYDQLESKHYFMNGSHYHMENMTILKNRYNAQSANPNACRSPVSNLKNEANLE